MTDLNYVITGIYMIFLRCISVQYFFTNLADDFFVFNRIGLNFLKNTKTTPD